jgi:protein PhnA
MPIPQEMKCTHVLIVDLSGILMNLLMQKSSKLLIRTGNELKNGDSVIVIKNLPVKGSPKPIKAGTKVKNIRLNLESDHNIDCKIDEFGAMALKSEFVRKF